MTRASGLSATVLVFVVRNQDRPADRLWDPFAGNSDPVTVGRTRRRLRRIGEAAFWRSGRQYVMGHHYRSGGHGHGGHGGYGRERPDGHGGDRPGGFIRMLMRLLRGRWRRHH